MSDTLIAARVTADWFGVRHADSRPRNDRLVRCQTRSSDSRPRNGRRFLGVRHVALIAARVATDGSVSDTLIAARVAAGWFGARHAALIAARVAADWFGGVRHADSRPRSGRRFGVRHAALIAARAKRSATSISRQFALAYSSITD
ncbi:MAG: hypothetical protein LBG05_09295 [Treponema sp.]|nr:hypothetical protein [Treponema sp.]